MLNFDLFHRMDEAQVRDPRLFPYGCHFGGMNQVRPDCVYYWFSSPADLIQHLRDVQLAYWYEPLPDEEPQARALLEDALCRVTAEGLTEELQEQVNQAFFGICDMLWWGTFQELVAGGGAFCESEHAVFRDKTDGLDPRAPENEDLFVQFLAKRCRPPNAETMDMDNCWAREEVEAYLAAKSDGSKSLKYR